MKPHQNFPPTTRLSPHFLIRAISCRLGRREVEGKKLVDGGNDGRILEGGDEGLVEE